MNEEPDAQLDMVYKMRSKGRRIAARESLLPTGPAFAVCALAGLGLVLLVEYGALALLAVPAVTLVLIAHYRQLGAKPYFFPTKIGLRETSGARFTDPAYIGFLLLGLAGLVAFPFLIIKTFEWKDSGVSWASTASGIVFATFLMVIMRLDHYFARKQGCDE